MPNYKRVSINFEQTAHDRLKEIKQRFGLKYYETINALLVGIDLDNNHIREILSSKKDTDRLRNEALKKLSSMSPEQIMKILQESSSDITDA